MCEQPMFTVSSQKDSWRVWCLFYASSVILLARYVGAHQDLKFWGITPLVEATAWVAIDRCQLGTAKQWKILKLIFNLRASPLSGAMKFLPGRL